MLSDARALVRSAALAATLLAIASGSTHLPAKAAEPPHRDSLSSGFLDPPNSARPRVWWHWMNGNVTEEGIRKDLQWMARVGIGGMQNFDIALQTPVIVDKRLVYMSPEWKHAFRYAARLADELGLELAIAASPGWSETGGPWVQGRDAMKKLVWSEIVVNGGRRFNSTLPHPPSITGPYQDLGRKGGMLGSTEKNPTPQYYADVAVLAHRIDESGALPLPRMHSATGEALDAAQLMDDSHESGVEISKGSADNPGFVRIEYDAPQTVRSITLYVRGISSGLLDPDRLPALEASNDGNVWRKVTDVPLTPVPTTVSFTPVVAQHFRLVLRPDPQFSIPPSSGVPGVDLGAFESEIPPMTAKIADLRLSGEPRINRFELKAGYFIAKDYYALDANAGTDVIGVDPASVVDLTTRVTADGRLDWTPPKGRWRVTRLGYSLTGKTNHPATTEATGPEVDKYDGAAVRNYMHAYLGMFSDATGADLIGKHGLRALLADSTEIGASNWTADMIAQFQRLRGYDPRPWLPALTGVIVGSRSRSDAFLYDFRRTLSDLSASEHYGQVVAAAHEQGLLVYGEALESDRSSLGDEIDMRSHVDVPMAAFWTYPPGQGPNTGLLADMKGAASVAHVYGQNLAAAESLTAEDSPWAFAPSDLKHFIDLEFAFGINRPVIHTSVHQPLDDKLPGLSLDIFGQYFNRHETWADMAKPWVDYISRNSFMLQQGRNVADVAYFIGEEAPMFVLFDRVAPDLPVQYAYDLVNGDAVQNRLSVDGNELVAASGARYSVLYLGGSSQRMTLAVLRRIAALAQAGATIVGMAPESSPSLEDDAAEFAALVHRLWSGAESTPAGKGRIVASRDVESVLRLQGLAPDFSFAKRTSDAQILFVHRRLADADIYFLNNRRNRFERTEARFRVGGKKPEIWHADTGKSEQVSYRFENGQTVVPLEMLPEDSFFVVFRAPAGAPAQTVTAASWSVLSEVGDGWDVSFQADRGAPASTRLETLQPLSSNTDPGIRYFSGTSIYRKTFELPRGAKVGAPLSLDLGRVGDVAEVRLNGKPIGTVWKAPFRVDIGGAVHPGKNDVEIHVANLWVNRLIGDAQPGAKKITFTTVPTYRADAPLRPSGLIGPVTLLTRDRPPLHH